MQIETKSSEKKKTKQQQKTDKQTLSSKSGWIYRENKYHGQKVSKDNTGVQSRTGIKWPGEVEGSSVPIYPYHWESSRILTPLAKLASKKHGDDANAVPN